MKRPLMIVAFALAVAIAAGIAAPAIATGPPESSRVVIVLSPYMTWTDLDSGALPTLRALAEDSAIGNLNVRSRSGGPRSATSLTSSALMLSAGTWALEDAGAPGAYNVDEGYETGDVAHAYARYMGRLPEGSQIAYLGLPRAQRVNDSDSLRVVPGALGQAVRDAGGITAAIGNSDTEYITSAIGRDRPAAIVAMDEEGLVGFGDVSRRVVCSDDSGPCGLSTDLDRFEDEMAQVWDAADEAESALIVLDPGDANRAVSFADVASADVAELHRLESLATLDRVVEMALESSPEEMTLIVATIVPAEIPGPVPLTPLIVHGEGWGGRLTSDSTHRPGLVTLPDVTATVLDVMGIERPVEMIGSTVRPEDSGEALDVRREALEADNATDAAIDSMRAPVLNIYITLTVLTLIAASLFVSRRMYPQWVGSSLRIATLGVLALPVASYLMFALDPRPSSAAVGVMWLAGVTAAVWGIAVAIGRGRGWMLGLTLLCSGTAVVLLADAWIGAPLSRTGYLSYSPLMGARFYGLGNEGAGLLIGSMTVGLALIVDALGDVKWATWLKKLGIPLLGAFAVWTAAAAGLGANVGVAVWGVVTFAVFWIAANGVRMSWKVVAVVLIAIVAVVALLSLVDVGGGSETHLARALDSAERGGLEEIWLIVVRKVETNLRVLTHTNWAYVLIAVLGLFGFMRWKPRGEFMETLERFPAFSHATTALLVGGVAAYLSEDSGIVVPALMLLYPGAGVLYLMLSRTRWSSDDT